MTTAEIIAEWEKGCSIAGPVHDAMFGLPAGATHPAECIACTSEMIKAVEREQLFMLARQIGAGSGD